MTEWTGRTRRWLSAGAGIAACAGAFVAACGAFEESTPTGSDAGAAADSAATDGAAADAGAEVPLDAASPDAAPACAKPLVTFSDSFTTGQLKSDWQPTVADGGGLYIGNSPDAGKGPIGQVLRAAVNVEDGGSGKAFAMSIVDVPPLASVDLSYVALIGAKAIYAETGCRLALRNRKAASFTANLLGILREKSGALVFSEARQVDDAVVGESDKPIGLDVINPARWHSVNLHVDVKKGAADVALTMTDLLTNETKSVAFADLPLVDGIDALQLDCGLLFASNGSGPYESAVDEVSLSACPR